MGFDSDPVNVELKICLERQTRGLLKSCLMQAPQRCAGKQKLKATRAFEDGRAATGRILSAIRHPYPEIHENPLKSMKIYENL